MNAKEYLQKAEKPRIVAIDQDGNEVPMNLKDKERPSLQDLRKVCGRQVSFGRVTFIDTFHVGVTKSCSISRIILYYDNMMVGMREIPDTYMMAGDELTVKFALVITIDHAQVTLEG